MNRTEEVERMTLAREPAERATVNISQACALVGVTRRTIYNWMTKGRLEYLRTADGSVRIYRDTLWRPGKKG